MRRFDAAPDSSAGTRLASLEAANPDWGAWLRLLGALGEALCRPWGEVCRLVTGERKTGAPLLDGFTLEVEGGAARELLAAMLAAAGLTGYRPAEAEAVALLGAEARGDRHAIATLAKRAGWDVEATATVVRTALIPFLDTARAELERAGASLSGPIVYGPPSIVSGCPICAAWPILAELRGLDRSRWLRCGRCGSGWQISWLCCAFCGERDHERLGALVPEGKGDMLKVETCFSCRGWLKAIQTLRPLLLFELLLTDAETVELDLAAEARGFTHPRPAANALRVRLVARSPGPRVRRGR